MSSSLYSTPIASTLSKDPSGVDPANMEKSNKLEPGGVHLEQIKLARKAARMQRAAEKLKNVDVTTIRAAGRLKNLDVAALVGAPPPPPKTPPPKKVHQQRPSSSKPKMTTTPQQMSVVGGSTDLEVQNVVSGITSELDYGFSDMISTSVAGDKLLVGPSASSFESISTGVDDPPPAGGTAEGGLTTMSNNSETHPSNEISAKVTIAEQRRRTALAMYQSTDLVLDQEEQMLAQQLLRPAMTPIENQNSHTANTPVSSGGAATPSSQFGKSPSSLSTRPHSNQTYRHPTTPEENKYHHQHPVIEEAPSTPRRGAEPHLARAAPLRDSPMTQSPHSVAVSSPARSRPPSSPSRNNNEEKQRGRMRGFSRERKAPPSPSSSKKERGSRRGFSLERRSKTDPTATSKENKRKDKRDKKKGFFKKIFGGGGSRGGSKDAGSVASKDSSRRSMSSEINSQAFQPQPPSDAPAEVKNNTNTTKMLDHRLISQVQQASLDPSPRHRPTDGEFPFSAKNYNNDELKMTTTNTVPEPVNVVPQKATQTSVQPGVTSSTKSALKPVLKSPGARQYQGPPLEDLISQDRLGRSGSSLDEVAVQQEPRDADSTIASTIISNPVTTVEDQEHSVDIPDPSLQYYEEDSIDDLPLTLTNSDDVSSAVSSQKAPRMSLSQDPPDDEHGDPPMRTGKPLLSPTNAALSSKSTTREQEAEQARIETARSRISELYHQDDQTHDLSLREHTGTTPAKDESVAASKIFPSSFSQDTNQFYFDQQHDEVSILTGPSYEGSLPKKSESFDPPLNNQDMEFESLERRSKSFDPSSKGVEEPAGDSMQPFDEKTNYKSLSEGAPEHLSHLRVQVNAQNLDPDGDSPKKFNSARGKGMEGSTFQDPVGESPVAWKKASTLHDPVGESPMHAANGTPVAATDTASPSSDAASASNEASTISQSTPTDKGFPDPSIDIGAPGDISDESASEEKKEDDKRPAEVDGPLPVEPQSEVDDSGPPPVKLTSGYDADESGFLSETTSSVATDSVVSGSLASLALSKVATKTKTMGNTSRATRAALRLSKRNTGKEAIKAQLEEIPTPKSEIATGDRVGSTPLLAPSGDEKILKAEADEVSQIPSNKVPRRHEPQDRPPKANTANEKSGFKSKPATPASSRPVNDSLTISTAAYTNAKAVAYLHQLHGEPSPRHSWHSAKKKKPAPSPDSKSRPRKSKKKNKQTASARTLWKAPSPSEYGAHNFSEETLASIDVEKASDTPEDSDATPKRAHLAHEPAFSDDAPSLKQDKKYVPPKHADGTDKVFAAYNSKFYGRKPSKKKKPAPEDLQPSPKSSPTNAKQAERVQVKPKKKPPSITIPGEISAIAVGRGFMLRRMRRKDDIESGRSTPVIPTPKTQPIGKNRFNFVPANEEEIKDPIQRAGRRLLSKAAIPIQRASRQYLAKREVSRRMKALITIQSYVRRWRCEANLQANVHSAKLIQTSYRGRYARKLVKDMQYAATQIQKIVRGHLAAARVYDTIYYIVLIQALMKGCYTRKMMTKKKACATTIQKNVRGYSIRVVQPAAASKIQSAWRAYSGRLSFQFAIVDIIIVQSIVRMRAARKQAQLLKQSKLDAVAIKIQAGCRGHIARRLQKKSLAATKIQSTWRGFQCYTDFIFSIVDILVVQRTMRQWLARRQLRSLRENKAATAIQTQWRRQQAQKVLVFSMVHIIIAQSVARRWLAQNKLKGVQSEVVRREEAATRIQAAWRGFWGFSHYIIVQYELVKIQAQIRGILARQNSSLKLGCGIIIQALGRQYLAKRKVDTIVEDKVVVAAAAQELRERNAAKRIQFWWRIVLDWTKEKKAALTIERFFIHVRAEVDREIRELERKQSMKKEKRKKSRRKTDSMDQSTMCSTPSHSSNGGSRRKSAPLLDSRDAKASSHGSAPHRTPAMLTNKLPSPGNCWPPIQPTHSTTAHVNLPTDLRLNPSNDFSVVSNITNPTFLGHTKPSQSMGVEGGDVPSLAEAVSVASSFNGGQGRQSLTSNLENPSGIGATRTSTGSVQGPSSVRKSREGRMTTQDYIKKYGPGKAATPTPKNGQQKHFFSDDGGRPHKTNPTAPVSQGHSTPRGGPRSATNGYSKVVLTPKGYSLPPSTPRSSAGTPRNHGAPSPRPPVSGGRQNFYPPVTPTGKQKRSGQPHSLSRRDTAETESQTTMSHSTYARPSPRSYQDGQQQRQRGGNPNVMVMKAPTPKYTQSYSMEEAHEMLYLGDEYGEV